MSKRSERDWLGDIVSWGERMQRHVDGVDRAKFLSDELVQDAVAKCIEALGEAAGKLDDLDPQLDQTVPDLNLKLARRMRDRMSHGYYKIHWGHRMGHCLHVDPKDRRGGKVSRAKI